MANDKRMELNTALEKEIMYINKQFLIPIQRKMYECSTNCCSNKNNSVEDFDLCIQQCSLKVQESRNYVTLQMNNYQERLMRCVNQCNDEAKDKLSINPTDAEVEKASRAFDSCASTCVDKNIELLPHFMKKMHEVLGKNLPLSSEHDD